MKINPKQKKWIVVGVMALLSMNSITSPVNLKAILPSILKQDVLFGLSVIQIAAYLGLVCVYWMLTRQTD